MNRWAKRLVSVCLLVGAAACTGGTAYVGVYGPPVYGPGPWGPYPGGYPPYGPGGGVWVGVPVCCYEEEQEQEDGADQEEDGPVEGLGGTVPTGSTER